MNSGQLVLNFLTLVLSYLVFNWPDGTDPSDYQRIYIQLISNDNVHAFGLILNKVWQNCTKDKIYFLSKPISSIFTKALGFIKIKLSGKVAAYKICQYQSAKQNIEGNIKDKSSFFCS